MAVFRQIHVSFWQDAFILDLTPEEKYFYLYLMTNSKTTQCGVYELPKKVMEIETGYNRETVDKLLQRFVDYGKIKYHEPTKEVLLCNWLKYNANKSPKVLACIKKELSTVKHRLFKKYCIDTLSIDLGEEKEKEKEEEKEEEQQEDDSPAAVVDNLSEAIKIFSNNIHPITPIEAERLEAYLADGFDATVITYAIQKAILSGARNMSYIDGILKRLRSANIMTMEAVEVAERDFQEKKNKKPAEPVRGAVEYKEEVAAPSAEQMKKNQEFMKGLLGSIGKSM